ncbi:MAG: hypothetical protein KBT30_01220 [Clostridiales bacterium]|nr:hypothetical protein [Candidatus Apopatousia equi]
MIDFTLKHKDKFEKVFHSKSHAILLNSDDETLLFDVAQSYAMSLSCKQENKPCLMCSNCLKVLSNNSLDTFVYPKGEVLLNDEVMEILDNLSIVPAENEYKVFIIKNFEKINPLLQNKLLKSIEEPPKFVKFVLLVKNKLQVLETIISRCEVITLPKFENSEFETLLQNFSEEQRQILTECSNGNLTLLNKIMFDNSFIENYNFALNLLINMKKSGDLLKFSSEFIRNKQNLIIILNLISNFLNDIMMINEGDIDLVKNKYCLDKLKTLSLEFSTRAILNIQKRLLLIDEKIKSNANINLIIDDLLLSILEEKWNNKK